MLLIKQIASHQDRGVCKVQINRALSVVLYVDDVERGQGHLFHFDWPNGDIGTKECVENIPIRLDSFGQKRKRGAYAPTIASTRRWGKDEGENDR